VKIVACGATGRTGRELVRVGLERGHEVTALVHDAHAELEPADRLHVVYGDVLVRETLPPAVTGADAVLWAVGPGSADPANLQGPGIANVAAAMRAAGVRRLVALSSSGVGDRKGDPWWRRLFGRSRRTVSADDLRHMEVALRQSGLEWTIVRATKLLDEPARGRYRVGPGYSLPGSTGVARADMAAVMLDQLETDVNVDHAVAVSY
jgi:putative NADH-flavin reductase